MKKIISFSALFLGCFLFAGTAAFGAASTTTSTQPGDPGTLVTLSDPGGTGPDMEIHPSPSNLQVITCAENQYAITSMNAAATDGQRMEYGIWSENTGYFQMINGSTASPPVFTVQLATGDELSTNPFAGDGWTNLGGGGS